MSASTRTAQQPLGIGQLGAALIVVAVALVVAVAIAFGSLGATRANVTPVPAGAPPAVIDHGWSEASSKAAAGAPPAAIDHGSSESSMTKPVTGDDGRKGDPFVPANDGAGTSGSNGPRLRPH